MALTAAGLEATTAANLAAAGSEAAATATAAAGLEAAATGWATAAAGLERAKAAARMATATAVAGWATVAAGRVRAVARVRAAARAVGRTDSSCRLPAAPPRPQRTVRRRSASHAGRHSQLRFRSASSHPCTGWPRSRAPAASLAAVAVTAATWAASCSETDECPRACPRTLRACSRTLRERPRAPQRGALPYPRAPP